MKQYETTTIKDYAFDQNAYVITNKNKEAIIIDPGYGVNAIKEYITSHELSVKALVLTHYHFDHVAGVDELAKAFDVKAYVHVNDFDLLINNDLAQKFGFAPVEVNKENVLTFEEALEIPGFEIRVQNLPGHSKGSTLLFIENEVFTGDVLFINAIGRTDLVDSSEKEMTKTIKWIKENIDPETLVKPGHGEEEMFKNILKNNKYLI